MGREARRPRTLEFSELGRWADLESTGPRGHADQQRSPKLGWALVLDLLSFPI